MELIKNLIKIQCPAKINLALKVLNKREDGFHNIDSIMQTISLFDYLTIEKIDVQEIKIKLSGTSDEIPYDEKNLVHKACVLFFEKTGLSGEIKIHIEKNIPVSAGLAGGSTNAAGALYGLNKLFNNPLSNNELHELCAKLGSDLNFCLEGGRKQTLSRGEIIKPLEFEEFSISLIKPKNLGISAKEAYTKFSSKEKIGQEEFLNHLEWAVLEDYQELKKIKQLYPTSIMSGSGPTYFIINDSFETLDGYWVLNDLKTIPHGVKVI